MNNRWLSTSCEYDRKTAKIHALVQEHEKLPGSRWPKTTVVAQKTFWIPTWGHGWFWTLNSVRVKILKFQEKSVETYAKNFGGWDAVDEMLASTKKSFGRKSVKRTMGYLIID